MSIIKLPIKNVYLEKDGDTFLVGNKHIRSDLLLEALARYKKSWYDKPVIIEMEDREDKYVPSFIRPDLFVGRILSLRLNLLNGKLIAKCDISSSINEDKFKDIFSLNMVCSCKLSSENPDNITSITINKFILCNKKG